MICVLNVPMKRLLLLTALTAALFVDQAFAASVETFVETAPAPPPVAAEGKPLSAGELTMQDILSFSSLAKKKTATKPVAPSGKPTLISPMAAPSPVAKAATVKQDTPGSLLIEGMQSVFGVNSPAAPAATGVAVPSRPMDVAKGVSVAPLPDLGSSGGACAPKTSSWVKTCAEAGYPESYVGQIRGETRTTCPSGGLQDVWVANSCSPPDGSENGSALTGPQGSSSSAQMIDASCGVSNGLAASTRPVYDLCASGNASVVAGDGPWHWNCQGSGGGLTVSCAAPVAEAATPIATTAASTPAPVPEDAQCGPSNGLVADIAPVNGLCTKGAASKVNGQGPWTWACSGTNGGHPASCTAPKRIDGVCGAANGSGSDQMPRAGLCDSGYASAVTGNGPWAWTCSGLNGGQAATCSAEPRMNAVCGPASMSGHSSVPKNALCSVGQPSAVNGNGPWTWTCSGTNGGASVTCDARVSQNGSCGLAHGTSVTEAPMDNLCANGKPSRVSGTDPWNWACSGTDGGDTASCTATRATERIPPSVSPAPKPKEETKTENVAPAPDASPSASVDVANLCGSASEFVAIEAPTKNLCKSGTASNVTGRGPWNWTCNDNGQQSNCSTLTLGMSSEPPPKPVAASTESQNPSCGSAAGHSSSQEPATDLCASGKASSISGKGPWNWTCAKGKAHVSCQAEKTTDGSCGTSNGATLRSVPTTGLCSSGTATPIQGTGPWLWTCVGSGSGASSSCSATALSQTRVDGACGASANTPLTSTPSTNLCDGGVASAVYGEGPWTWTCSGLNGGVAASCATSKSTPPAPPPPGPAVNGLCGSSNGLAMVVQPMDNLCSAGTPTAVSGNGPWNWNCIGENSGMTVSCTAPLQPPAPISGICGAANGVPTLTTPRAGLCNAGISSAVSGKGPWTWSCSGVNGGSAVGCVAPLAGNDVGSLPSMTTQTSTVEAPPPASEPVAKVTKKGLVTPRLPSASSLPPIKTGGLPAASQTSTDMTVPAEPPQLPPETESVSPPPVRDMIQPAPALVSDTEGNVLPGNHFVLDDELTTIPFANGSDNYDTDSKETLDKLVGVLKKNGSVRITLTAYADSGGKVTPREARRLSLSRALAIRDYLSSKGISSGRIDVRALGANVPSGEPDRVDIKAN